MPLFELVFCLPLGQKCASHAKTIFKSIISQFLSNLMRRTRKCGPVPLDAANVRSVPNMTLMATLIHYLPALPPLTDIFLLLASVLCLLLTSMSKANIRKTSKMEKYTSSYTSVLLYACKYVYYKTFIRKDEHHWLGWNGICRMIFVKKTIMLNFDDCFSTFN